jgi:hypothetical protein|tara:strand:- start:5140 stop:5313 length:174 start_codon:yes stop_codon:yes gene_type:complete
MNARLSPTDYIEFERRRDILKSKGYYLEHNVKLVNGYYNIEIIGKHDVKELDRLTEE